MSSSKIDEIYQIFAFFENCGYNWMRKILLHLLLENEKKSDCSCIKCATKCECFNSYGECLRI